MLACLTSESSVFHEHVREMCHRSLRHWQTFPAFYLFFILPFSPSNHKYDIGHIKLSLHSLHYIKTFTHSIHNKGTCNTFTSIVLLSNIEYNETHTLMYHFLVSCLMKLLNTKNKMYIIINS
jgi:hypothetical protein